MCGICGIIVSQATIGLSQRIQSSVESISHRGPDHQNSFVAQQVALGHARLSIVDLSAEANQPMACPRSGRQIVFNGEIYNFAELRAELECLGYCFRTRSDTEILLQGYDAWGTELFRKLNGIFAFAIWDAPTQEVILCRDRFGVKPLYYSMGGGELVFGSEVKAILAACPNLDRSISLPALHEFSYYGTSHGSQTIFERVQALPPATWAKTNGNTIDIAQYWTISSIRPSSPKSTDAIVHSRSLLEQAVASQLIGDVPIGVFLSGGLDSSSITAFASRHYSGRLKTYSVGFDFNIVDELPLARKVAAHFGTEHHEVHIRGASVADVIQKLVCCHDSPFSDAANIPLYLLSQELSGQIKVVLQGDGGDEVFGGYRRYATLARERLVRSFASSMNLMGLLGRFPIRTRRYLECFIPRDRALRFARLLTMETMSPPPTRIFSEGVRFALRRFDPFARYREVAGSLATLDAVQAMLLTDMQIVLPDVFLEKVDKSTMAHGLEVRVPLLENRLTDYLISLPSRTKIKHGEKKWLLKQAMRGILPDEIIDAPKRGFGVPFSNWLRGPLAEFAHDTIHCDHVRNSGLLDLENLDCLLREHKQGTRDHGFLLWKAMNFAIWLKKYGAKL